MFPTRLSLGVGTKNTDRLGVFRHPEDETALPQAGLSSGVGTKRAEIKAKLP